MGKGDLHWNLHGTTIVELEGVSGSITLDSELQEAYSGTTGMNSVLSGEFPILKPGMNAVIRTGRAGKVEIRPRWRYL